MKYYTLLFLLATSFLLSGCSEEGEEGGSATAATTSGWHFQGRDCLACHNVDLATDRKLVLAGTLFKNATATDFNNSQELTDSCNADLALQFVRNIDFSVAYSTADSYDANSKGYKGQGNIFGLARVANSTPPTGDYLMRVVDRVSGINLAQSTAVHKFSGASYDITNSADATNQIACNTCHGITTSRLYISAGQISYCK